MVCSRCGLENGPDKIFCTECGAKLISTCPRCGAPKEGLEKYCGHCGQSLTLATPPSQDDTPEASQTLQRYFSKELIIKILNQWHTIRGEQRPVTFLVCDFSVFPRPIPGNDSPGTDIAFEQIQDIIFHKINDYKGTVNEYSGSKITGIFGAPLAIEDAPLRAVRAAWAIHREILRLSQDIAPDTQKHPIVDIKTGIHTGPVVLKALTPDIRVEFEDTQTMDIASAVAGLSESGTIYISEATFYYTEGFFRFECMGTRKTEGAEKDIMIYRMLTPSSSTTVQGESSSGDMPCVTGKQELAKPLVNSSYPYDNGKSGTSCRSTYLCGTPWKNSVSSNENTLHTRTKGSVFLLLFYLALIAFMTVEYLYPDSPLTLITGIFDNLWANTVSIASFLLILAVILYWIFNFAYVKLFRSRTPKPRLGEMLLNEGYISDEELHEALAEQDRRLGDILLESGRLTMEQLNQALDYQKHTPGKIGQILKDMGLSTDQEIDWALNKLNRRLGEILRDKGLLSEYNLYWVLRRQLYGTGKISKKQAI